MHGYVKKEKKELKTKTLLRFIKILYMYNARIHI